MDITERYHHALKEYMHKVKEFHHFKGIREFQNKAKRQEQVAAKKFMTDRQQRKLRKEALKLDEDQLDKQIIFSIRKPSKVDIYSAQYLRNLDLENVRFEGSSYIERGIKKQKFQQVRNDPELARQHMAGFIDDSLMVNFTKQHMQQIESLDTIYYVDEKDLHVKSKFQTVENPASEAGIIMKEYLNIEQSNKDASLLNARGKLDQKAMRKRLLANFDTFKFK